MTAAATAVRVRAADAGGAWLLALPVAAFILVSLAWPVATVLYTAFADGQGGFTIGHVSAFLSISLMREAFVNSLVVALGAVAFATLIAVPLAYLTVRFEFRGAVLVQTLGVLPLVMPPFVGAVAMQLLTAYGLAVIVPGSAVLTALLGMVVGGLICLPIIWSEIKLLLRL